MNRLKLKLRELNEEQREKVIRELYREFKGRYHERDEGEYEKEEIHKGGEEHPLNIDEREHEGINFESEYEGKFTKEKPEFREIPEREVYPPSGEERHEERYEERDEGKYEDKEVGFEKDYEKEEKKKRGRNTEKEKIKTDKIT